MTRILFPILMVGALGMMQSPAGGGAASEALMLSSTSAGTAATVAPSIEADDNIPVTVEALDTGALLITAFGGPGDGAATPIRFQLQDGESLSFALPGQFETLYAFERQGDRVIATTETIQFVDLAQAD